MPRPVSISIVFRAGVAAALVAAATPVHAEVGENPPGSLFDAHPRGAQDPKNAALLYYKLWINQPAELEKAAGEQLRASDPAWRPDARLTKLLEEHSGWIAQLLRATQAPEADFGMEWSQGIAMLLPHLGKMRSASRILACDARRCLAEGRHDEAAERVAAIYRMAGHAATDGVMISGLVSVAMARQAGEQVDVLMANTGLSMAGKQALLVEMRRLAGDDPFGVRAGMRGEARFTGEWLRSVCKGERAGAIVADEVVALIGDQIDAREQQAIRAMDEAALHAELDRTAEYYRDVLAIWDAADAAERLKAMETRLKEGEYGIVAKVLAPAVSKAHASDRQMQEQHAERLRRLAGYVALPNG